MAPKNGCTNSKKSVLRLGKGVWMSLNGIMERQRLEQCQRRNLNCFECPYRDCLTNLRD